MKVNSKTLLFEDLSNSERIELQSICEDIILYGRIPPSSNRLISTWLEAGGFKTDGGILLVISTVFPARALLSICFEYERFGCKCSSGHIDCQKMRNI